MLSGNLKLSIGGSVPVHTFIVQTSSLLLAQTFDMSFPSPVASSVIHMHILKGALTRFSTTSAAHWTQQPEGKEEGRKGRRTGRQQHLMQKPADGKLKAGAREKHRPGPSLPTRRCSKELATQINWHGSANDAHIPEVLSYR